MPLQLCCALQKYHQKKETVRRQFSLAFVNAEKLQLFVTDTLLEGGTNSSQSNYSNSRSIPDSLEAILSSVIASVFCTSVSCLIEGKKRLKKAINT